MYKDRGVIVKIISDMLDNPGSDDIYPTSTCYTKLEHYIEQVRAEAIGWCYAEACTNLDKGIDLRAMDVPSILKRANKDLDK